MSSRPLIAILLSAALMAGGCDRQSPEAGQAPKPATNGAAPAGGTQTVVHETIGTLDRSHKGEAAPLLSFKAPDGKPATLADFRGKPVLLHLWATWCAPCVAEMPTLDTLAGRLGDRVRVITLSQDLQGRAKVDPFFAARKFAHLQPWTDENAGLSLAYQANLPTTILIDSSGHEVWRMAGGMDWTGGAAADLIAEAR